jgi:hypothetical protein
MVGLGGVMGAAGVARVLPEPEIVRVIRPSENL